MVHENSYTGFEPSEIDVGVNKKFILTYAAINERFDSTKTSSVKKIGCSGRSRGGGQGARVPTLFIDQVEARRDEEK